MPIGLHKLSTVNVRTAITTFNHISLHMPSRTTASILTICEYSRPAVQFCSQGTLPPYLHTPATSRSRSSAAMIKASPSNPLERSPPKRKQPIHWILDWDGTITKKDTLNALVSIAASTKPDFPTQDQWQRVSKAYMDDYTSTLQELAPNNNLPKTIEQERALLQDLKAVEQRSLDRVAESSIFSGLTKEALEGGAAKAVVEKKVALRDGFTSFYQVIQSQSRSPSPSQSPFPRPETQNLNLTILSVNWSRHFIASCLSASGISLQEDRILSNELSNLVSGYSSTGYILSTDSSSSPDSTIISSPDKLLHLEALRKNNTKNMRPMMLVYVGDSLTDLECLVAADLGVCMRDEEMGSSQRQLAEALERLGVDCVRLSEWKEGKERVAWVKDFGEIQDWMESRSK
jgi:2-hydroxy-3-keto-5-methylthiopentenyl-1-phosphate phosphatase